MDQSLHLLKIYKKPQYYGFLYHFYLVDETNGIEIHPGEFEQRIIRPIKESPSSIYMGLQLLCEDCYSTRLSRLKFFFFPFVNCGTLIMNRLSLQFLGMSLLVIAAAQLFRDISFWPIVILVIIGYLLCQKSLSAPSILLCDHVSKEEANEVIEMKREQIKNISL